MSTGAGSSSEGDRLRLARELLIEAHHRARASTGDLGPHGRELLGVLWPRPMAPTRRERLLGVVRRYVDRAEALARRRDRFVHDFRAEHGFDRSAYTADEASELADGLTRLDVEVGERLVAAALELLEPPPES